MGQTFTTSFLIESFRLLTSDKPVTDSRRKAPQIELITMQRLYLITEI
jgi:hypothetical protein